MNNSLIRYLLFNVSCIFCWSCASDYRYMEAVETNADCISKLAPNKFNTAWYHASVDVVGKHISGLLLIKNMPDSSYRIVFTNEAGVTFFDFGFTMEGDFKVYNILKQLDKKPVIQTLRKDFALILGLPFRDASYHTYIMNEEVFFGVKQKKEMAYFITSKDCASLRRLELGSARKRKVTVHLNGQQYPTPDKIELVHNTFSMQINLTRFEKE
jgi:hypothetical protein